MKHHIFYIFVFALMNNLGWSQADVHICSKAKHFKRTLESKATLHSDKTYEDYDVFYQRMEWSLDPKDRFISGDVTFYFSALKDSLRQVTIDLRSNMSVSDIARDGRSLLYFREGDKITVNLSDSLAKSSVDSFTVSYSGIPKNEGFGSFVTQSSGSKHRLWTLSEPYGGRDWWPCKQDLNDKIDSVDIHVSVPNGYRVASNGILVDESIVSDTISRFHWKHRYPIASYLVAIAIADYAVFSDYVALENGDSLEILNYVYPEDLAVAKSLLPKSIKLMELFTRLFGEYPFSKEKYGHAQFGWGGGMEHQTMSFMGNFGEGLQAHELAHQWFGNKVTCGSWKDIWLNEGFASYLEGLVYENSDYPLDWAQWKGSRINYVVSQPDGSVFVRDTSSVSTIFDSRLSYAKGAYLLHMIRWIVGDENFFKACRNYLNDPRLAYSFALTEDFIGHVEAVSGKNLDEFFDDWFFGQGYPQYHLEWYQGEIPVRGGTKTLSFNLSQQTSHTSVDFFEMPVPIRITFTDNSDSIIVVDHSENLQSFNIDLDKFVDRIEIDPNLQLISANNRVTRSSSILEVDEDTLISIAPNVTSEYLNIITHASVSSVYIFDVSGKRMARYRNTNNTVTMDVSDWSSGIYFVVAEKKDGQRITKRIIKL